MGLFLISLIPVPGQLAMEGQAAGVKHLFGGEGVHLSSHSFSEYRALLISLNPQSLLL